MNNVKILLKKNKIKKERDEMRGGEREMNKWKQRERMCALYDGAPAQLYANAGFLDAAEPIIYDII